MKNKRDKHRVPADWMVLEIKLSKPWRVQIKPDSNIHYCGSGISLIH